MNGTFSGNSALQLIMGDIAKDDWRKVPPRVPAQLRDQRYEDDMKPSRNLLSCLLVPTLASAALLGSTIWAPASSQGFAANCKTNAQALRGANLFGANATSTSGTTMVDVPETEVTFTTQGNVADCVVVVFTASAVAPDGTMFVRALLDGQKGSPTAIKFAVQTSFETGTAIFVFEDVAKGDHTVKMQFRSSNAGVVTLQNRAIMVLFKGQ